MDVLGTKTLILGAGRSGVASARFLARRGAVVALHDRKPIEEWSDEARSLRDSDNVGLMTGELPSWLLDQIDLVVISPGVPTKTIPARYVDRKDGEVIGEVELAYRFLKGRLVGITGSNGKTTTTALIGEILKTAGFKVQVGGNIGNAMISLVDNSVDDGWSVVELSSFQLETIKHLRPDIGICLNVTPNHLDRYDSFLDYAAAKHRLFMNQTVEDTAILNVDNEITAGWAAGLRARKLMFSTKQEVDEGCFLRGRNLVFRSAGKEMIVAVRDDIFLPGLHNVENVLAAIAAGVACGAGPELIAEAVRSFRGVEHRIEFVADINGVKFYNDSKATSVDAAMKALEALADDGGKTVLILGGLGKNAPYAPLIPLIERSVSHLILIGEDADNIEAQLGGIAPIMHAGTLEEAVQLGSGIAESGDKVLLAPACASFDMFRSFEERGNVFKKAVADLAASQGAVS